MTQVEFIKSTNDSNLGFTDYFPNSENSFFLLTYNLKDSPFLKSVNAFILEEVLKLKPNSIPELEIKSTFVEFFNDLNWKVNAMFNKAGEEHKGLSLFFAVKRSNRLYFVQFGRLACGLLRGDEFKEIGLSWSIYPIATVESLKQLGSQQDDIPVNVYEISIVTSSTFFTFPSKLIPMIQESVKNGPNEILTTLIAAEEDVKHFFFFSKLPERFIKPLKFFQGHSFRTSAIAFGIIILITILYYFFGDNIVEQIGFKTEETLTSHNILFELKNLTDSINNPELEKQLAKYVYSPAKDVSLKLIWQGQFTHDITHSPLFDLNNIYLIIGNNIAAVSKRDKEVVWQKSLNSVIKHAESVENNLLIHGSNKDVMLLNSKGEIIWQNSLGSQLSEPIQYGHSSVTITRKEDKRLNSGLMVSSQSDRINIFSLITGDIIHTISFNDTQVKYISDYDSINNCFYAVVGQNMVILKLQIKGW